MRAFDQRTTGQRESTLMTRLRADRRIERADEAPPFPLKVQVQTWTRCNAACAMCPYPEITGEPSFTHQRMAEDTYRRLLDQLSGRGVERFSPFLMNEPLLDKRMPQWIKWARDALPETRIGLFSNGTPLTPELAVKLADAGLDELCVSVHGFDKAVNRRVMGGVDHDRVLANLALIKPMLHNGRLGQLHLQIVMGDLPELTDTLPLAPPELTELVTLKAFSNERAVSDVTPDLASSDQPIWTAPIAPLCQRPFVKLYVMTNGDCVACNCDWRRREVLGNLRETSVEAIWQGAHYRRLREEQLKGQFGAGHLCAGCDYPLVTDDA